MASPARRSSATRGSRTSSSAYGRSARTAFSRGGSHDANRDPAVAMTDTPIVDRAREIAEAQLFPRASETDAADLVPRANLDALASAGLYGITAPADAGGLDADFETYLEVVEILAGACLATTFIWLQHPGVVRAVAGATQALRERFLGRMCRGEVRAGIALGGLLAHAPGISARRDGDGWIFDGNAPWVTGWGRIDVLQVAGVDAAANVVYALVEATPSGPLQVGPILDLVALRSSATAAVRFSALRVSDGAITLVQPLAERERQDHITLRGHAALAVGVAARCVRLLGETPLSGQLDAVRRRLATARPDEMPAAKAAAAAFAHRAAAALVVSTGSRSLLRAEHADRLAREALFLLVFGSRPAIKAALLDELTRGS